MVWDIPIYEQGELRGQLKVNRQGLRTIFQADCPAWDSGIKKVWLRGERGSLLLGTLVPEGNRLRLGRTISNAMLREKGLERCNRSEIEGTAGAKPQSKSPQPAAGDRWLPAARLSLPGMDPALAEAIRSLKNGVWRREPEGICVCCPWQIGQRMPCMPIFCFASYSTRRGGMLTWFLDEQGNPLVKRV